MAARLTQEYVEALVQPAPTVRLTWESVEVLIRPAPVVRNTQIYVEVLTPSNIISIQSVTSTETITQSIVVNKVNTLSVTSTLVPTQNIISYNQLNVEQELDITQQIDISKVNNLSVTSTLSITQTTARIIPLIVTSTLTMTQDDSAIKYKIATANSDLTLTHSNTMLRLVNRLVNSNIFLVQSIGKNLFAVKSLTNTLSLSQTIVGINAKPVKNTLTFTQDIDVDKAKLVRSTIEYTQLIFRQLTANRTIMSLFNPYNQISRNVLYNRTVTSNLGLTQQIIAYLTKQVTSALTLTQTIDVLRVKNIDQTLTFMETILLNQVRNLTQTNTLDMFQTATCNKVYSREVSNTLAFEQILTKKKAYLREVTNTLVIGQEVFRTRYNRTVTSTFAPSNVIDKTWVVNRAINQSLNLISSVSKQNIYSRSIVSNLDFLREFRIRIGDHEFVLPTIHVAKAQRYTVITGGTRTIVLPNPEFGDGESNTGKFSLRRGMAGKVYTYVKKTYFRKLNYTFHIGRTKAKELMDFIIENNTNVVTLTNFKGETWYAYIISNPNDIITQSRFASACDPDQSREKSSVTLEFEGVKVGSPIGN